MTILAASMTVLAGLLLQDPVSEGKSVRIMESLPVPVLASGEFTAAISTWKLLAPAQRCPACSGTGVGFAVGEVEDGGRIEAELICGPCLGRKQVSTAELLLFKNRPWVVKKYSRDP